MTSEAKPQPKRRMLKALSQSLVPSSKGRSTAANDIEEVDSAYRKLLKAVNDAEEEEKAWRYLYFRVSGDAEGAGLGDWVRDEKHNAVDFIFAQGRLKETHANDSVDRTIVAKEGQVVEKPDAFYSAFNAFKAQPKFARLVANRAPAEERSSLLIGIEQRAEETGSCRKMLEEFKASDGFVRLEAHERTITLAAYKQLLAKARKEKENAKEATKGLSRFEKELVGKRLERLRRKGEQPFQALVLHVEGSRTRWGRDILSPEDLKLRCAELQALIQGIESGSMSITLTADEDQV